MSVVPSFVRQLWGGGINRDRTEVLMYVGYIVRNFSVIHRSWKIVHHHRVGGVDYRYSVGLARGGLW